VFVVPGDNGTSTQKLPSGSTNATAVAEPLPCTTTVDAPGAEPRTGTVSSGVRAGAVADGAGRLPPAPEPEPQPGSMPPAAGAGGSAGCSALQPAPAAAAAQRTIVAIESVARIIVLRNRVGRPRPACERGAAGRTVPARRGSSRSSP